VTLGEGWTPLVAASWEGLDLRYKLEYQSPTGSFKDRGASVLVTALQGLGVERVVEDSSGNAGASLAAYTARAGIRCEVCIPDTAAGPKLTQIESYGAEAIQIRGRREYAALAAWAAAAHGAHYASHVYSPFFLAGIETMAYEIWEQLGEQVPGAVVLPVGNGTLLLGLYTGFRRLVEGGAADRVPRLIAVQAESCAPLFRAHEAGSDSVEPANALPTVASAIAIGNPARGNQILAAVRESGGGVCVVAEEQILDARNQMARQGFLVEPTSAVNVAAIQALAGDLDSIEPVVLPLTGHGLKAEQDR
jgi:threonine synthase